MMSTLHRLTLSCVLVAWAAAVQAADAPLPPDLGPERPLPPSPDLRPDGEPLPKMPRLQVAPG